MSAGRSRSRSRSPKQGDRIAVDWTGSSPQVKGAINNTLSYTKSASYCAIRSILPQNIPTNEGVFRAISVTAPEGTIANMVLPGACAARGLTGFRMVDCMFGALAKMLPDQVFAASDGGNTGVSIGGWHQDRTPFIYVDFTCCAWGARPYADGLDGNSHIYANMASQPIEVTESEQPLQITAYEFIQDAMGPGKFRGGAPFRREYRLLADEAILQVRSDRHAFRPFGLYGGGPGRPSMNYLNPDRNPEPLPSKLTMTMKKGDLFRHEVAGGGGWGDPLERDPALVLQDVLNEFVSPHRGARGLRRRADRRAARGGRGGDAAPCARRCGHGAATGPFLYTIGERRWRRSRKAFMTDDDRRGLRRADRGRRVAGKGAEGGRGDRRL